MTQASVLTRRSGCIRSPPPTPRPGAGVSDWPNVAHGVSQPRRSCDGACVVTNSEVVGSRDGIGEGGRRQRRARARSMAVALARCQPTNVQRGRRRTAIELASHRRSKLAGPCSSLRGNHLLRVCGSPPLRVCGSRSRRALPVQRSRALRGDGRGQVFTSSGARATPSSVEYATPRPRARRAWRPRPTRRIRGLAATGIECQECP
jgi:hypothetical protein